MKNLSKKAAVQPAISNGTLHKAKFGKAMQFAGKMKSMLCFLYRKPHFVQYPNHALRYIIQHVMTDAWPNLYIDYSKVLISWGDLESPAQATAVPAPGLIQFTWQDNSDEGNASATDDAFLVAYCDTFDSLRFSFFTYHRQSCTGVIQVPEFSGHEVHTWFSFRSKDFRAVANSVYTGKVRVV